MSPVGRILLQLARPGEELPKLPLKRSEIEAEIWPTTAVNLLEQPGSVLIQLLQKLLEVHRLRLGQGCEGDREPHPDG